MNILNNNLVAQNTPMAVNFHFVDAQAQLKSRTIGETLQWVKDHLQETALASSAKVIQDLIERIHQEAHKVLSIRTAPQDHAPHYFCFDIEGIFTDNVLTCGVNGTKLYFSNAKGDLLLYSHLGDFNVVSFEAIIAFVNDYLSLNTYTRNIEKTDGSVDTSTHTSLLEALSSHFTQSSQTDSTFMLMATDDMEILSADAELSLTYSDKLEIVGNELHSNMDTTLNNILTYLEKPNMPITLTKVQTIHTLR